VEELKASLVQPPLSRQERHAPRISFKEHRPAHLGWVGVKCAGDRRLKKAVAETDAQIAGERANYELPRRWRATVKQLNEEVMSTLPARRTDRSEYIWEGPQLWSSVRVCRLSRSSRLRQRRAPNLCASLHRLKRRPSEWPLRFHQVFNSATEIAAFIQQLGE
jgi:hypothetical protein